MQRVWHCTKSWWPPIRPQRRYHALHVFERSHVQPLDQGGLALRLPSDAREAFLKKYKTKLCVQYETVMKEYVEVPDALLRKTPELRKYFDQSYAYVGSLKPKPTTKKAATKKR